MSSARTALRRRTQKQRRHQAGFVTFDPHTRKAPPVKIELQVKMQDHDPIVITAGLAEVVAFEREFDVPASEHGATDRTQPTGTFEPYPDDHPNAGEPNPAAPQFKSLARFEWLAFIAYRAMVRQKLTNEPDLDTWLANVEELGATEKSDPVGKG